MKSETLLSICIPTYNRAFFLERTLKNISSQISKLNRSDIVEVVIADNCSTDNTQEMVLDFLKRYPNSIRYIKNDSNILDKNFEKVLRAGNGKFRKLHNDTLCFKKNGLQKLVDFINKYSKDEPVIFFANGNSNENRIESECKDLNEFVANVSFYSTWIGGFGIWENDLTAINPLSEDADQHHLFQVDALITLIGKGKKIIILNDIIKQGQPITGKGGYNVSEVFGQNYFHLLQKQHEKGNLKSSVLVLEKYRCLNKIIFPFFLDVKCRHEFDKTFKLLNFKKFFFNWFFYALFIKHGLIWFVYRVKMLLMNKKRRLRWMWRKRNKHNQTILLSTIDFNRIQVGRMTYGDIEVFVSGNGREKLYIGSFCSIAREVLFLLEGEHYTDHLLTYPVLAKFIPGRKEAFSKGSIMVDDDVWIGRGATILSGLRIGQGAVIGAKSVVTKDVPPYAIVCGNPAKIVKYRFDDTIISKLLEVDFTLLSESRLINNLNLIYEKITSDNIDHILEMLLSDKCSNNLDEFSLQADSNGR